MWESAAHGARFLVGVAQSNTCSSLLGGELLRKVECDATMMAAGGCGLYRDHHCGLVFHSAAAKSVRIRWRVRAGEPAAIGHQLAMRMEWCFFEHMDVKVSQRWHHCEALLDCWDGVRGQGVACRL